MRKINIEIRNIFVNSDTYGDEIVEGTAVSVEVNASDSDGSIDNVRLSVDGTFIRQENTIPYEWDDAALQGLSVGTHELSAVTTDSSGATSTATITFEVIEDTTSVPPPEPPEPPVVPPTSGGDPAVAFNSLVDGGTIPARTSYGDIKVTAFDGDGSGSLLSLHNASF